jgi:hypothetical protein
MGVWQRRSRCQTPNLSPLRMLNFHLPTFVKCNRLGEAVFMEVNKLHMGGWDVMFGLSQ